jgi:hypothetical protein
LHILAFTFHPYCLPRFYLTLQQSNYILIDYLKRESEAQDKIVNDERRARESHLAEEFAQPKPAGRSARAFVPLLIGIAGVIVWLVAR